MSPNDFIVAIFALSILCGFLVLFPGLWKKKWVVLCICLLLFFMIIVAMYTAYFWKNFIHQPPFTHDWIEGQSVDLQGKPIDPKEYQ